MYEQTNLQSARIEHQVAAHLADCFGQHVAMSPWRQALVSMRGAQAHRLVAVAQPAATSTPELASPMPRGVMQIELATR